MAGKWRIFPVSKCGLEPGKKGGLDWENQGEGVAANSRRMERVYRPMPLGEEVSQRASRAMAGTGMAGNVARRPAACE